jgi:two-component system chemotaxis sensor kinase CheA
MSQQPGLRQEVENLAMKLVMNDLTADGQGEQDLHALTVAFAGLGLHPEAEQWPEVGEVAMELSAAIASTEKAVRPDLHSLTQTLQEGLTRIQKALETSPAQQAGEPSLPPSVNPLAQDPELLSDFILEAQEHLTSIENQSLAIERDPEDSEAIHGIFRSFHTIKGLAGFLELAHVQEVAHEVETILDLARNAKLEITPTAIDVILASADYLKACVANLDLGLKGGTPPPLPENQSLLQRIRSLPYRQGADTASPATPPTPPAQVEPAAEPAENVPARVQTAALETRSVKVDTAKLDYLVDMAGEMVIAQSLVRHDPDLTTTRSPRLQRNLSQLARITSELQKTSMAMRLVPIGQLFQRMVRLVRDLSRKVGKPAEVEMTGEETEIDRTIVEELADPLMHMVRNALDHGVENPTQRQAAGKPQVAQIGLRASHQSGHIVIEISDDGRGLNREKILAKAAQKGLIESAEHLSDNEIFGLIFEPGFSTAEQVTDVSGRGVGMDVVRKQIQKLRGRIEITSKAGEGTTFVLKLPLTLAIIDGLVVGVGEERYIVPLFAVREMFRPAPDAVSTVQGRAEMVLVRGSLLPVIRLYRRFGVSPRSEDASQSLLIVSESEGKCFCLMVDELIGKQEVVIKSLGETFKNIPGIAGGAILGDGRVGLILDLDSLGKERRHA